MLRALVSLIALAVLDGRAQAQPRQNPQLVTGVAVDTTGAVLPNAQIVLTAAGSAAAVQTVSTDANGVFRLAAVPPGRYEVTVSFEGFQPTTIKVTVGSRAPGALRIVLPLANVRQEITVSN